MTTTARPYPPPRMRYDRHVTVTLPAWHENPLLKLHFDVSRMKAQDVIEYNGYTIRKTWTSSEGNRWHVYKDGTAPQMFRDAQQAVDAVNLVEQQEAI